MTNENNQQEAVKLHVAPDLDYVYRDMVNIFVGTGDVILEFGNKHRSMPGHITVSNRIVLTMANAFDLQKRLEMVLTDAQEQIRKQMTANKS